MIRKVVYFSMQVPNRPGIGVQMLNAIAKGKNFSNISGVLIIRLKRSAST